MNNMPNHFPNNETTTLKEIRPNFPKWPLKPHRTAFFSGGWPTVFAPLEERMQKLKIFAGRLPDGFAPLDLSFKAMHLRGVESETRKNHAMLPPFIHLTHQKMIYLMIQFDRIGFT